MDITPADRTAHEPQTHTYHVWGGHGVWRAQCSCMEVALLSSSREVAEDDRRVHLAWAAGR